MTACKNCNSEFEVTDNDLKFLEKTSPVFNGQTYLIPKTKKCPECRFIRLLNERNARSLYRRKCDFSGKKIISQYHENQPFPVYDLDIWWSDKWDAMDYGIDFDFSRGFFEQFQELKNKVPHFSAYIIGGTLENSNYTNCTGYLKNCYLIFESDYNEDCYYSNLLKKCKNVIDCSICYEDELCYECIDCISCNNLKYSQDCKNCNDSFFLKNCIGCNDCIGCINQRQKKYMIFNKQYSKEEYEKIKSEMKLETRTGISELRKLSLDFCQKQPHKAFEGEQNENCTGDHIYNSKNSHNCFDSKDLEDCKNCYKVSINVKDCQDYSSWGDNAELVYYSSACGDNINKLAFCTTTATNMNNAYYCDQCVSCNNVFGCMGLNKKKYCILNKQYTKEEYEEMVPKIIEHMKKHEEWGEYFPKSICPFGYNETIAMEYFPKTKEEAIKAGYKWNEYKQESPKASKIIKGKDLPETINEIDDSILDNAIECEVTGRLFKITEQELKMYKRLNLPIPSKHYDVRHQERMDRRLPRKLFERKCDKCGQEIKTPYLQDSQEIVYCESCYLKEVA